MKLRYSYHSEHNASRQDPYLHFIYFATALLFVFLAWMEFNDYLKRWTSEDDAFWPVLMMVGYLISAGLFIWQGVRTSRASRGDTDRYVRIDENELIWDLTQVDGEQRINLADVQRVERRSIRDLELTLQAGDTLVLPIYLIANHEKQEELLKVLYESVPPVG